MTDTRNFRQKKFMRHLCDVISVSYSVAVDGTPNAPSYAMVERDARCAYVYTDNISTSTDDLGRVKRPDQLTIDHVVFTAVQNVQESWYIRNKTILPDGTHHPLYGEIHVLAGQPDVIADAGNRRANKRKFEANAVEKPPPTLPT